VGIEIRYLAPAAAGSAFAYSVERREDRLLFDFELCVFRRLKDIPSHAVTELMIYHDGTASANFNHLEEGKKYIFRVHRIGQVDKIIATLPVTACTDHYISPSEGGQDMEPSYRSGKKFIDNRVVEARYRLTVYGDDGFTIHTATLWEDGTTSCNCPRWGPKVDGKRRCIHSVRAQELTDNVDETGERPPPAPKVSKKIDPVQRRSRPVDT
jgi:hypothetical protein